MKVKIVLFVLFALTSRMLAQEKTAENKIAVPENIYTSLRPADAQPAVFSSQEQLNTCIQDKKNKTIALIRENEKDPVKVKVYREQLWRFENAVVKSSAK